MATEFQSKIFETGFFKGEHLDSFKEDIQNLKDFESSKLEYIINFVKKIIVTDTKKEEEFYDEAVKSKLVNNVLTIRSFHRISNYFFKAFNDEKCKEDEPEIIIKDIAKKLGFEQKELSSIKKLLEIIKQESDWYGAYKLQSSYNSGLLPFLEGIGTTVELRGVFNREIEYGETLENYKKEVEINKENPIVPAITIAITLDSGTPKRFCFQSSPERTEWLIEELKAALYKLKILEEAYKKNKL